MTKTHLNTFSFEKYSKFTAIKFCLILCKKAVKNHIIGFPLLLKLIPVYNLQTKPAVHMSDSSKNPRSLTHAKKLLSFYFFVSANGTVYLE